jgi:hypothetical protein
MQQPPLAAGMAALLSLLVPPLTVAPATAQTGKAP